MKRRTTTILLLAGLLACAGCFRTFKQVEQDIFDAADAATAPAQVEEGGDHAAE